MATTMYELLMQLPVFQGISTDQLTEIIEKIPFSFSQFEAGETVLQQGDECSTLTFILSGRIRTQSLTFNQKIQIQQEFEGPYTMPFYTIFGADTRVHETVVALSRTGVMQLDKANFLKVLQQNPILLINVMNMLCTNAQKHHKAMDFIGESDLAIRLASWIFVITDQKAENIFFECDSSVWYNLLQVDEPSFWRTVAILEGQKILEVDGTRLKLLDRYSLRTFIGRKSAQNL